MGLRDSRFDLKTNKEEMNGTHQGRTMHFDIEAPYNAHALIQGEVRYAKIQNE